MGLLIKTILGKQKYITTLSNVGDRVDIKNSGVKANEYDVIIIGGGTAGCVLAARLSEDPSIRVLVLEAGRSGVSNLLTRIPSAFSLLFHTRRVYNFYTEPQEYAQKKIRYWPRGKMLGGCSSINAQMAQYGAPSDFDQWAEVIGDESWSWKNFGQYFRKFENYTHDPSFPEVDVNKKGSDGPVHVGYFTAACKSSLDFVEACKHLGIPYSSDFNQPSGAIGVNKVAVRASVTRVIFENVDGKPRAIGVEFTRSKNGPRYEARAKKDVILAAGAIHSPHVSCRYKRILLLSGVGPKDQLKKHGIQIVHDLPGVGKHLVDHPVVDIYFKDKLDVSPKHIRPQNLSDAMKFLASVTKYLSTRRGPLTSNFGESAAFIRSDDPALFSNHSKVKDSTSSPNSPDLEIFTTPMAYKDHGRYMFPMHTFSIHTVLLRPLSRGILSLKSAEPFDSPLLDPHYLEAPEDVERLVRGVKLTLGIAKTEPLAANLDLEHRDPRLDYELNNKSDQELADIIRERVETLYHPACTCRMAPLSDHGVVDSSLRVYGIDGLRICDASVFTEIVSGHTAGAVLATAEKLSDDLKKAYATKT
ncbi:GMC oxidoreductase [Amanita thiersii Skay4041]|uniref:GMC oxidoreductase n=1 Tax=Amanita thiersii Skay4041 TaxID=703135 RepID=A0A2A9NS58_9AGAR|nr:GMC oxidoreductase [Amanita thiersii Skay4041]